MKQLNSYDPSNGELVGNVDITLLKDIGIIVDKAHFAVSTWGRNSPAERAYMVIRAFAGLEPNMPELDELISWKMGKDFRRANSEVSWANYGGPSTAQAAKEALLSRKTSEGTRVEYKPLGVAAVISP